MLILISSSSQIPCWNMHIDTLFSLYYQIFMAITVKVISWGITFGLCYENVSQRMSLEQMKNLAHFYCPERWVWTAEKYLNFIQLIRREDRGKLLFYHYETQITSWTCIHLRELFGHYSFLVSKYIAFYLHFSDIECAHMINWQWPFKPYWHVSHNTKRLQG